MNQKKEKQKHLLCGHEKPGSEILLSFGLTALHGNDVFNLSAFK